MLHTITLNIRHDGPDSDWQTILAVYQSMPGWQGTRQIASWFGLHGDAQYIVASVEPSGAVFEGQVDAGLWTGWLTMLCARLSLALNREIHDAEM
ncbi:hypothetical protein [Piscinibacter gummiphilus]|uniref:Uncharacterized protein n=1 Tax=Piscinibacter gummiphilus TaxID=946333 RepID=A0A1W6LB61_9BURK|nr:hypothetical protein [Piscinibacter gummiphilus]ARN21525.1 hypothetical protein A4W93_17390 [Piscinibacter gummiphilus]ATU66211.1 hypothetical protein CPZ87_17475 [Piscinibacter gummiphilus]GLS96106.1 hypothetical protein GCM10007918_33980 [Piscinibacter gummiphilus]